MLVKSEVSQNYQSKSWSLRTATLALVLVLFAAPVYSQNAAAVPGGACGPMDVVFVIDTTGSMGGAIDNIISDLEGTGGIIDTILNASGNDERLGLVVVNGYSERSYDSGQVYDCMIQDPNLNSNLYTSQLVGDCVIVLRDLGSSTSDVTSSITALTASAGGFDPEITAEALRTVLEGVDQTGDVVGGPAAAAAPAVISGNANDWPRLQWNNWNGTFRPEARKVIILVTDNVPGGSDGKFNQVATEDSDLAAAMASAASAAGVVIQPVLVALSDESFQPNALAIMQNYADTTGGTLMTVPYSGEGTALSITSIVENCGGDIPEVTEGRMTGGGSIFNANAKKSDRVTHGFTLHCSGGPNNLEINWAKNKFHMESLTGVKCYDYPELDEQNPVAGFDTLIGSGVGRLNGVPGATVEFTFVDDGEPGKVSDTATIKISNGGGTVLEVTGTLENGNQQAHP